MKAALVSATSLAALLAFEVGLDVAIDAQPARAQTFTATPSPLNFGYVLLNSSVTTSALAETVSNKLASHNVVTLDAVATTPFSGPSIVTTLSGTSGTSATAKTTYTFAPTVTGAFSASLTISSSNLQGTSLSSVTVPMTGTAVAPVQKTILNAATTSNNNQSGTTVRIGTTATIAALTVSNIGDGYLYNKTATSAQLQVSSIGVPSGSVFKGSASSSFQLNDSGYTGAGGTTSFTTSYSYAPTAHATDSSTVNLSFANGSSLANNASQTASVVLTGRGVGPTFESTISTAAITGTTLSYSNSTAIGSLTVNTGQTVSIASNKAHVTSTVTMTISNATTDGVSTLTNLTLENFTLGSCAVSAVVDGCSSDGFSVIGFTAGAITAGNSVDVMLDFSGGTNGYYNADLSFTTDQGAAFAATGTTFTYFLVANIPEPATVVTFGMGLAGLGWVRRRRAARRSAGEATMAAG